MKNPFYGLPTALQSLIYTMDPTYRQQFDQVVMEMNRLLSTYEELQFKSRYRRFFGSHKYAHMGGPTGIGHYRVATIGVQGPWRSNSIDFRAYRVLMYMQLVKPRERLLF